MAEMEESAAVTTEEAEKKKQDTLRELEASVGEQQQVMWFGSTGALSRAA